MIEQMKKSMIFDRADEKIKDFLHSHDRFLQAWSHI